MAARGLTHNNLLFRKKAADLSHVILSTVDSGASVTPTPVPVVKFEDLDWEIFYREYLKPARPVVIKGFPLSIEQWSLDWFIENYGDTKVILTTQGTYRNYIAPLCSLRTEDPAPYLHNCEQLFLKNKELLEDLGIERIKSLSGWQFDCAQLFFGSTVGGGATFHCARETNFFFQIRGQKRWTFVDPQNTPLIYPYFTPGNAYQDSLVKGNDDAYDREHYPVYRCCPRLQVTLDPGDILYSPSWWWHAIHNVTPETIGASTRWSFVADTNSLFSALIELTPERHASRRMCIENVLRNEWVTAGLVRSSEYGEGMTETIFEANSHSENVAIKKESGEALGAWF